MFRGARVWAWSGLLGKTDSSRKDGPVVWQACGPFFILYSGRRSCAGHRRRENGVAVPPPGEPPGGSFFTGSLVPQPPRHLLEHPTLIGRQAVEAVLGDLVEHAVELV